MTAFFFVMTIRSVNAQTLAGRWQEKTPKVSSGYLGNYQFSDDGTFLYNTNEYFGLARIKSLEGNYTYNTQTHVLSLTVLFVDEIAGGTIERSKESGEATDSWTINGGEIKKIKLIKPAKTTINVEFGKSNNNEEQSVFFDKVKYYKVE